MIGEDYRLILMQNVTFLSNNETRLKDFVLIGRNIYSLKVGLS